MSEHTDTPSEIAARVLKNLQKDLENKLAEVSQHFLKAFGGVDHVRRYFPCFSFEIIWLIQHGVRSETRRCPENRDGNATTL